MGEWMNGLIHIVVVHSETDCAIHFGHKYNKAVAVALTSSVC